MPWQETPVMQLRTEFVLRVLRGVEDFGAVCREYGISRKTGYKWKERFLAEGLAGLHDQSRRPHGSPQQIDEDVFCQIVNLKTAHRDWGARKILAVLARHLPADRLPSESSCKRILEKSGLTEERRRRKREEQGERLRQVLRVESPNQLWTIDFKGWWYTRDRQRFEPLTIRDDYSRFILCARALENGRTETVQQEMIRVFERFGLPEVIRSDNGSPFASRSAPLGLSRLSAWWLTLGIHLDRIEPGHPEQNGRHERMHRDMARELEKSAAENLERQQAELDVWRQTFNEERPHEALDMQVPQAIYQPSPRRYDPRAMELEYPEGYWVRKVSKSGTIKLQRRQIAVSQALRGYEVGLEPVEQGFALWFCRLCLGQIDPVTERFHPTSPAN